MSDAALPKRVGKIAIIGAGNIGKDLWRELIEADVANHITVYNRSNKFEDPIFKGMESEIDQASRIRKRRRSTTDWKCTNDLEDALRDADIVVVTTGAKRKPGQSRSDLIKENCAPIDQTAEAAGRLAPRATYIIATNPVDTMTQRFQEISGIAANRIVGLSGVLDRARLEQAIAQSEFGKKLAIKPEWVEGAGVIGQHGDAMVPVLSNIMIHTPWQQGKLVDMLNDDPDMLEQIRSNTINGGKKLIELLGTSAWVAPAAGLLAMVEDAVNARNGMPSEPFNGSAFDPKTGVYIGRPVQFGSDGSYRTLDLPPLSLAERHAWTKSVAACEKDIACLPDRQANRAVA